MGGTWYTWHAAQQYARARYKNVLVADVTSRRLAAGWQRGWSLEHTIATCTAVVTASARWRTWAMARGGAWAAGCVGGCCEAGSLRQAGSLNRSIFAARQGTSQTI